MPSRTNTTKKNSSNTNITSRRVAPNPITERKRAARNAKPLKQIFKGKFITSTGQFENSGRILGPADIAGYVESHGGVYEKEVSNCTTHLICTIEDYKKKHAQVQAAWRLGKGRCSIVVFDWLLDCTVSNKKACRAAGGYTLDRTIKRLQQGKRDLIEYRKKFQEGLNASKEMVDNRLWHIYYDSTAFEYKVILTRINLGVHSDKPMVEKYTLYLFESHAKPHLYMCGAKLSRSHRPSAYYRENCHAMEFHDAFRHFQHFFKDKTGLDWDQRLEKPSRPASNTPPALNIQNILGGRKKKSNNPMQIKQIPIVPERKFTWTPPIRGRPVGLLPYGYVRPEDREEAGAGETSGSDEGSGEGTSGESGESGVDSGNSKEKSGEDVVYDTDSDVDSDDEDDESSEEEGTPRLRASGINFGADLALAREFAQKVKDKSATVVEILSDSD